MKKTKLQKSDKMSRPKLWCYTGLTCLLLILGNSSCRKQVSTSTSPPGRESSFLHPFTKVTLPNGLRVILKEIHSAPIVAVYFFVNTGAVNETAPTSGISHFYEHMFFKGTKRHGLGEMDRIVKGLGGYNNAFTSIEYTGYYIVVPKYGFETAFHILLDAMRNSIFDLEELKREREVVKEEIRHKNDLPGSLVTWEYVYTIFDDTPYGNNILGTSNTLDGINREDMLDYMHSFYVPNNMAVVVAGDIDPLKALSFIKEKTADFLPDPEIEKRLQKFDFLPQERIRQKISYRDTQQAYIVLGFPTQGRKKFEDIYPLDVIAAVLGGGKSSRLYQRLLEEERIVTSIECWHWSLRQAGTLAVETVLPPDNRERVMKEILTEIRRILKESITEEELSRAKMILKTSFILENETSSSIARTLGSHEIFGEAEEALEYLERIEGVTLEDVRRVVAKYLLTDSYTISMVLPNNYE